MPGGIIMKKTAVIMAAFVFVLTGCADTEAESEKSAFQTEESVLADALQTLIAEPKNVMIENMSATDDAQLYAAQSGGEPAMPLDPDTLTEPPAIRSAHCPGGRLAHCPRE